MRILSIIVALFTIFPCFGQESLIVYGKKGNAYSIVNKKETEIRVGNILPLASSVRLEEGTVLTLLCRQGIRFLINRKGTYSLYRYKDSCKVRSNSVSSNYLSYLWGQIYSNSADHKLENHESTMAVTRGEGKKQRRGPLGKHRVIDFSKAMDTVKITGRDFQLCWNCFDGDAFYQFKLYDKDGLHQIWSDSTDVTFISTSGFHALLQEGSIYKWNITAPDADFIRKRVIKKVSQAEIDSLVQQLEGEEIPGEDKASNYFRIAYVLERKHYLAEAWSFYTLAREADKTNPIIKKELTRFLNEFYLPH